MSIPISCAACGYQTTAPDSAAGMKGKCPKCGAVVRVPGTKAARVDPDVIDAEVVEAPPPPPIPLDSDPISLEGLSDGTPIARAAPPTSASGGATDRRPCPACGEMIAVGAMKCRFCNEIFDPVLKKREAKKAKAGFVGGEGDDLTAAEWLVAILCSGIGCIVGLVWMISGKPKGKKMFLVSILMAFLWGAIRAVIEAAVAKH